MEENKKTNQVWRTPEIIDLDVEKTKTGIQLCTPETASASSCAPDS